MASKNGAEVTVVNVRKCHAKAAKLALEAESIISKEFRMVPSLTNPECIAIPVKSTEGGPWDKFVVSSGFQFCPYSTAVLGNLSVMLPSSDQQSPQISLTPVQQAILHTVERFISSEPLNRDRIIEKLRVVEGFPNKLQVIGDDRSLVIPHASFDPEVVVETISSLAETKIGPNDCMVEFWKQLAAAHHSPRIARRKGIDPDSPIRESGYVLVYPEYSTPFETGPTSPGWIRVTEQGVKQSFDITKVMFSRGNVSEKIRFGKLVKEGEVILDMYAGIGYYTLPALIHGKASVVHACEWNQHAAEALRFNVKDNGVDDRVYIYEGDCRTTRRVHQLVDRFDRVSLGLLPSSEGGWWTAVRALKPSNGGWLHIHANVPVKEVHHWTTWVCQRLLTLCDEIGRPRNWIVVADHVERVKSFAPTVAHYVADVFVGHADNYPRCLPDVTETSRSFVVENGVPVVGSSEVVEPPSCALSDNGALSQEWMR